MIGIHYFKADPSTFVIKSRNGKTVRAGRGLSFFYHSGINSIAAIPVNVQEAPFIFNLLSSDFQSMTVQGQLSFRIQDANRIASLMNFSLAKGGQNYVSEDPLKLADKVVRHAQSLIQSRLLQTPLRDALDSGEALAKEVFERLSSDSPLKTMGIETLNVDVVAVKPTPETSKALEAEAREVILKEADDAIYARRKSAVEQERTIKDAELETELALQQKEHEIAESDIANKRALLLGNAEMDKERIQSEVAEETQRQELVALQALNSKATSDAKAYTLQSQMNVFDGMSTEALKALAMAQMGPDQLMALAFESLASNADRIGELTITPDLFSHMVKPAIGRRDIA